jgi:hypothetical protein
MKRLLGIFTLVFVAACGSPEATRTQGGGPGAATGNRGDVVRMHEGSQPYHETPRIVGGEHAPLEGAGQARELSRR